MSKKWRTHDLIGGTKRGGCMGALLMLPFVLWQTRR